MIVSHEFTGATMKNESSCSRVIESEPLPTVYVFWETWVNTDASVVKDTEYEEVFEQTTDD